MAEVRERSNLLAIEVKGLSKAYGPQGALRDLNLELAWGEFLTIFGPNGSGKTTLIKVLSTICRPNLGNVIVAGFDINRSPMAIRRNIGLVTHQPMLYADLTGLENLRFHGAMFGLKHLDERIETVADVMGIRSYLGRKAGILSHGMQKRLSIARAVLHDPPILLLDEPETGLDQEALNMLAHSLIISDRGRRTVVMATHNVELGIALGDRMAIMSGGRIAYNERRADIDEAVFRLTYNNFARSAQ